MRDIWYSDKRDLVKWGVLAVLANRYKAKRVLQIAYYNRSNFGEIEIDGEMHPIPKEVLWHFRNIGNATMLPAPPKVSIFDAPFEGMNRVAYHQAVKSFIQAHNDGESIVFLDPDIGLEPNGKADHRHVLNSEVRIVWESLPMGWVLVFYQHQTNRSGESWVEPKRKQLAQALGLSVEEIRMARGPNIATDVVFFFAVKA